MHHKCVAQFSNPCRFTTHNTETHMNRRQQCDRDIADLLSYVREVAEARSARNQKKNDEDAIVMAYYRKSDKPHNRFGTPVIPEGIL